MQENTNIVWQDISDAAIVQQIGKFVKHQRVQQRMTQAQLAERAGLNRWTISQIENGESTNLTSLIQILRALECLYVFQEFEYEEVISPLEYAKLKLKPTQRVRNSHNIAAEPDNTDLGW